MTNRIQIFDKSKQYLFLCFKFPPIFNVETDLLVRRNIRKFIPKILELTIYFSSSEARGSVNMSGDNFYTRQNTYQIRPKDISAYSIFSDSTSAQKQTTEAINFDSDASINKILTKLIEATVDASKDSTLVTKEISENSNLSQTVLLSNVDITQLNIDVSNFDVDAVDHIAFTGDNLLIKYSLSKTSPTVLEVNNEILEGTAKAIYQVNENGINTSIDVDKPTFVLFEITSDMGEGEAEDISTKAIPDYKLEVSAESIDPKEVEIIELAGSGEARGVLNNMDPEPIIQGETNKINPFSIGASSQSDAEIEYSKSPALLGTTIRLGEVTEFIISIDWDEVAHPDVTGYNVYANDVLYASLPLSELEYTFTTLEQEIIYDIYVRPTYIEDRYGPHSNILTEHLIDIVSPKIPNKDLTISETINDNEIIIEFEKAIDGLTPQHDLTYHLYRSEAPNLDVDPDTVEANGILIDTQIDVDHFFVSDVTKIYYFNIIVEDQAGNKNLYNQEMYDLPLKPGLKIGNGQVEYYQEDDQWYALHKFEESGEVEVLEGGVGEICLIAGGGASRRLYASSTPEGADRGAGPGGGAGGVVLTKVSLSEGLKSLVIGNGAVPSQDRGEDSIFEGFVAIGGGSGNQTGFDGGSGGGGNGQALQPLSYGLGNNGGFETIRIGSTTVQIGGGGGAITSGNGRHGGDGIEYPEGSGNYYAGGGRGAKAGPGDPVGTPGLGQDSYGGGGNYIPRENSGNPGVLFIRYPLVMEPITITPIPDQIVEGELQLELSDYFHHSFQNQLEYTAISNNSNVTVTVSGSVLTIIGREIGSSDITVTATISDQQAQQTFNVNVTEVTVGDTPNISSIALINDELDYITIPNAPHPGTGDFTWSVWFKYKDDDHIRLMDTRGTGDYLTVKGVQISRHSSIFWSNTIIDDGSGNGIRVGNNVPNDFGIDGNWHNITITFDNSTGEGKFYGDFELLNTEVNSNLIGADLSSQYNLTLGRAANTSAHGFVGNIDEVQIWNRVLTREEIVEYGNKILTGNESGLVGYWNFEDRNSNQVTDLTPNQNHGILMGNPVYEYDAFDFDYALEFDGVNTYVEIGDISYNQFPITLEMKLFIKNIATQEAVNILGFCEPSTIGNMLNLQTYQGKYRISSYESSFHGNNLSNSDAITGEWIHLTVVIPEEDHYKFYINGVLDKDGIGTLKFPEPATQLYLGTFIRSGVPQRILDGFLDDVRIWNKALTEREIQLNMNKELTGNELGLIGYWKFDDLTDLTVAIDSSPNQNHGIIHG